MLANVRAQMRSEDDELCSARQFRHGVEVLLADRDDVIDLACPVGAMTHQAVVRNSRPCISV
jgi:hypothetical protein